MRPLYTTTNAAVYPSGFANAASTARPSFTVSISAGRGALGSTSPIGHGIVDASGSVVVTRTGVKNSESRPGWWMMHPWSP